MVHSIQMGMPHQLGTLSILKYLLQIYMSSFEQCFFYDFCSIWIRLFVYLVLVWVFLCYLPSEMFSTGACAKCVLMLTLHWKVVNLYIVAPAWWQQASRCSPLRVTESLILAFSSLFWSIRMWCVSARCP